MNKKRVQAILGNMATVEKVRTLSFDGRPCLVIYADYEPRNIEGVKMLTNKHIRPEIGYPAVIYPIKGIHINKNTGHGVSYE